ncbi:MAG TPA: hypothetical protein ENN66_00800 [Proteobacteria bacterium]|nr:hypothetical protein [Pseudomonadota bacterium]
MNSKVWRQIFMLAVVSLFLSAGVRESRALSLSSSKVRIKNPPPLHLSHQAPDLLDIARLPLAAAGGSQSAQINNLVQRLGDYLQGAGHEVLATAGVTAKPLAKDGSVMYAYGNWLVKTAESTGTRLLEVRLSEFEEPLLRMAPLAAAALPFRFIIMADAYFGQTFIHVCAVDPLLHAGQFVGCDAEMQSLLLAARQYLCAVVRGAFPEAYYDPQLPLVPPPATGLPALREVAQVELGVGNNFSSITDVVGAVQNGGVKIFSATQDEHPYTVNGAILDYQYLSDEKTVFKGTFSFPQFSMIKDGWKKIDGVKTFFPDWALVNHSEEIEALIQNSFIHVYGSSAADPQQRLCFSTAAGPIYCLQVFDGYTDPLLLHAGIWHFQSLPTVILFHEVSPGLIKVLIHDPVARIARYYDDVSDALLASFKVAWDADASNKTDWPAHGKMMMAERSREALVGVIIRALFPAAEELLLSPQNLAAALGNAGLKVIDARGSGYEAGHIPGALSLPHGEIADANMNLKPVAELEALLSEKGLQRTQKIVVYDDGRAALGAAARIFWMLEYLG